MSIQKFATEEAKVLIKLHTSSIYQWVDKGGAVTEAVKEALLANAARLYELLEDLTAVVENKKQ